MSWLGWSGAVMLVTGNPALAHDLCPDRPGIGTPACTMESGQMQIELGLGQWTREKDAETRTDGVEVSQALLRIGLDPALEAQVAWSAFGHVRERDRATGAVTKDSGTGDVTLALRRNLRNPDGSGLSMALMPYVSLPVGGSAIGAGDWGAGMLLPATLEVGDGFSLEFTGEVDAAVDEDRNGRHLAYGGVLGVGFTLGENVSGVVEASLTRDEDPADHATEALSGLALLWQPSDDMQFDIGLNIGLNRDSADSTLYLGVVRRF